MVVGLINAYSVPPTARAIKQYAIRAPKNTIITTGSPPRAQPICAPSGILAQADAIAETVSRAKREIDSGIAARIEANRIEASEYAMVTAAKDFKLRSHVDAGALVAAVAPPFAAGGS
jgi:hypothetical protein